MLKLDWVICTDLYIQTLTQSTRVNWPLYYNETKIIAQPCHLHQLCHFNVIIMHHAESTECKEKKGENWSQELEKVVIIFQFGHYECKFSNFVWLIWWPCSAKTVLKSGWPYQATSIVLVTHSLHTRDYRNLRLWGTCYLVYHSKYRIITFFRCFLGSSCKVYVYPMLNIPSFDIRSRCLPLRNCLCLKSYVLRGLLFEDRIGYNTLQCRLIIASQLHTWLAVYCKLFLCCISTGMSKIWTIYSLMLNC